MRWAREADRPLVSAGARQPAGVRCGRVLRRFRHEILPLLQEYAYDDYSELSKYVGPGIVDASGKRLKSDVLQNPDQLIEALRKSFMEKAGEEEAAEVSGEGLD